MQRLYVSIYSKYILSCQFLIILNWTWTTSVMGLTPSRVFDEVEYVRVFTCQSQEAHSPIYRPRK